MYIGGLFYSNLNPQSLVFVERTGQMYHIIKMDQILCYIYSEHLIEQSKSINVVKFILQVFVVSDQNNKFFHVIINVLFMTYRLYWNN